MGSLTRRLFLGFDLRDAWLLVVAITGWGDLLLKARFPLATRDSPAGDADPLAPIAEMLTAFIQACRADPVCAAYNNAPALTALAKRLKCPLRILDPYGFDEHALAGHDPLVRQQLGLDAHHRATLLALAAAVPEEVL